MSMTWKSKLWPLMLAFASLCFHPAAGAQDRGLQSRISRDSILIGDQIEWTFDFQLAPGEAARISKPGNEPVPGVEAFGDIVLDTLSTKNGTLDLRGHVTLTSFDSGSYVLPPLYVLMARADGSGKGPGVVRIEFGEGVEELAK